TARRRWTQAETRRRCARRSRAVPSGREPEDPRRAAESRMPARSTPTSELAARGRRRSDSLARAVRRVPGSDLLLCAPRAVQYARSTRRRIAMSVDDESSIPFLPRTVPLSAAALVDELTLVVLRAAGRGLTPGEIERIANE